MYFALEVILGGLAASTKLLIALELFGPKKQEPNKSDALCSCCFDVVKSELTEVRESNELLTELAHKKYTDFKLNDITLYKLKTCKI